MSKENNQEFKTMVASKLASIEDTIRLLMVSMSELKAHAMNNNQILLDQMTEQIRKIDYLNVEQVKSNEKPKTTRAKKANSTNKQVDYGKMAINAFIVHMYCEEEKQFQECVSNEIIASAFQSANGKKVIDSLKGANDLASKKKKAKVIYDFLKENEAITLNRLRELKKTMANSQSETQSINSEQLEDRERIDQEIEDNHSVEED